MQLKNNFMRQQRIRWRSADIQKKRAGGFQYAPNLLRPFAAPIQIRLSILGIGEFSVANAEIVRRRCNDKINTLIAEARHSFDAILSAKGESRHGQNLP